MHSSERNLILVVVSATLLLVGLWWAFGSSKGDGGPLEKLTARWSFEPVWADQPGTASAGLSGDDGRLDIYVDSSVPMGGFLSPGESGDPGSAFEAVLRSAPDQLARIDGGAGSRVEFFGFAGTIEGTTRDKVLAARFYQGGQSRLDLALAEIERALASGETEAALLVTDLIATGEVIGAQGAGQKLRDLMQSAEVRSGRLQVGLLGVKDDYRGVRRPGCVAAAKAGCRFSEQWKKWLPVEENAVAPFYLLVFARGREKVEKVIAGFADELAEQDFETQSEILSAASSPGRPDATECTIETKQDPGRRQFALFSDRPGQLRCNRSEDLLLSCILPPEPRLPEKDSVRTEKWLSYSLAGGKLKVELSCGDIRGREFPIELQFSAPISENIADKWLDWTSTRDDRPEDVGRTLRLKEFVQKVRLAPSAYEVAVKLEPGSAG